MKLGITVWNNRISPLFDVAQTLKIVQIENNKITNSKDLSITPQHPLKRADVLAKAGIDVLICGAISAPFTQMLSSRNIKVIPFIAGEFEQVLHAYLHNTLDRAGFNMPGFRRQQRRRFRGGRRNGY